ncbi:MAG: hypothetical protein AAGD00_10960 [Planctomycetota bacterium]
MLRTTTTLAVLTFTGSALANGSAHILLTVDVSDPSAVRITATGDVSLLNDSSDTLAAGVTLANLFTTDLQVSPAIQPLPTGDLSPSGSSGVFDRITNTFGGLTDRDLNLFSTSANGGQDSLMFDTATAAFTGELLADLTGGTFGPIGTTGDIFVGDTTPPGSGAIIGFYQIVPSPGSAAMLALAGLAATRRRR